MDELMNQFDSTLVASRSYLRWHRSPQVQGCSLQAHGLRLPPLFAAEGGQGASTGDYI